MSLFQRRVSGSTEPRTVQRTLIIRELGEWTAGEVGRLNTVLPGVVTAFRHPLEPKTVVLPLEFPLDKLEEIVSRELGLYHASYHVVVVLPGHPLYLAPRGPY
ncbi:MAG TPA: hypothetical protein VMC43_01195 [Candidatus Paceibacterota bacterium]|nr:hypothetical protein [Candidatus Paceibacterota bacterium]